MASIVADRALERRVLTARAMRFPLIVTMAVIIAAATLPATDAHAQFACVGTLGASDVTCTNTGATAVPFIQDQHGTFNLTTTSSGLTNGITTTSVDGNVTATNSGINADMLDTSASGLGNATSEQFGNHRDIHQHVDRRGQCHVDQLRNGPSEHHDICAGWRQRADKQFRDDVRPLFSHRPACSRRL